MADKPQSAEIHAGPGFRIRKEIERAPAAIIDGFAGFPTPDISDLMNRLYTMSAEIRNLVDESSVIGPACTVKVYPGDNLMVHKALDVARPGDIVVVDTGGARTSAVMGDLIAHKARHRGIAGFVIDGLVRDLEGIREAGIPVFARGVTPIGPLHRGPGELNYAITCGGIVVNPGDIIMGDVNGVVVIRREFCEEILERARAQREALADYVADVRRGRFSNAWVDRILDSQRCDIT